MYNQKDVADWILQSKPVITNIHPTIYHCSGLELTDTYTGETIVMDISKLGTLLPLVFSDTVQNRADKTSDMAEALHELHNPPKPEQPTLFDHAQVNRARAPETAPRGPVAQHKSTYSLHLGK